MSCMNVLNDLQLKLSIQSIWPDLIYSEIKHLENCDVQGDDYTLHNKIFSLHIDSFSSTLISKVAVDYVSNKSNTLQIIWTDFIFYLYSKNIF